MVSMPDSVDTITSAPGLKLPKLVSPRSKYEPAPKVRYVSSSASSTIKVGVKVNDNASTSAVKAIPAEKLKYLSPTLLPATVSSSSYIDTPPKTAQPCLSSDKPSKLGSPNFTIASVPVPEPTWPLFTTTSNFSMPARTPASKPLTPSASSTETAPFSAIVPCSIEKPRVGSATAALEIATAKAVPAKYLTALTFFIVISMF